MTTSDGKEKGRGQQESVAPTSTDGLVYVAPEPVFSGLTDDKISLRQIWQILWKGKGIIIAATALFAIGSVAYALLAKEIYRAEVLLAPAKEQSTPMLGSQLGGLAALAGVNVAKGSGVEALAVLKSREFARNFIEQLDLMPVFFEEDWDAEKGRWKAADQNDAPDVRDGVRYFHKSILDVNEDRSTGLVAIGVEWTDPEVAALWANTLVRRLNDRLREDALREAQTNVDYLQSEMAQTNLVTLQESIGRLLESELQQLMLAKGNEEFAYKIVDPAVTPKYRERPKRAMTAIIGTILGGLLGVMIVLILHAGRADAES